MIGLLLITPEKALRFDSYYNCISLTSSLKGFICPLDEGLDYNELALHYLGMSRNLYKVPYFEVRLKEFKSLSEALSELEFLKDDPIPDEIPDEEIGEKEVTYNQWKLDYFRVINTYIKIY